MTGFLAVLDPTWPSERGGGRVKRGAQVHYALARNVPQLAAGYLESEAWRASGPALVWIWATSATVVKGHAHALAILLDLRPCAMFVWAKVDEHVLEGAFYHRAPRRPGLGQWSRCEHEHLLLCRRGDVKVPPPVSRRRSVIYAPRGAHSEKPEAAWSVIEEVSRATMVGVRGVEFNSRARRRGWSAVGRLAGEDGPITFERGED